MRTRPLTLIVSLCVLTAGRGWSQDTPAAPAAPAPTPAPAAAQPTVTIKDVEPAHAAAATKSRDSAGKDTLSVDFPEEDIRNILRNVADLFELNLVVPDTLQGKTSIKLRDVTWRQIFQVVLDPVGYTYIEDGSIIKVVAKTELDKEPVSTEVFIVNYARAADILPTVSSLVDAAAGGKIMVDARSNSLVITERPSRMNRIRPIIEQLDRATDQVMIESKFVEVTDRDVKNLGVNWASLAGYGVRVGGDSTGTVGTYARGQTGGNNNGRSSSRDTSNGTNSSTSGTQSSGTNSSTTGNQSSGSNSGNTITSTNGIITATGTTGTTAALTNTSTNDTTANLINTATNGTTGSTTDTLNLLNSLTGGTTNERTLNAVFSADQFRLVLSALQTLNNTKIVSNPTIVTLNNTEATINVGEERPIPNYAFSEQTGTFQINGFTYKPIGVLLRVTPQVNARGTIKLTLSPEVSQPNGTVAFGGASGTEIPIVATRKATTQVSLKDGYTMGIGGLMTQNAQKGQNKVPVLGSIPLLGRLFRSDSRDVTTSNLIIFITAKSISADGAPIEEVFDSKRVRQLDMKREDLPGHRDGTDPFAPDPNAPPKKKKFFGGN